jgi:hypothetical protein
MKEITLNCKWGKGKVALVDNEDFRFVNKFIWYLTIHGYVKNYNFYLHSLIMGFKRGKVVDHIDHNKLNNQKSNLRFLTNQQNVTNQKKRKKGSSIYKGVYLNKKDNKWTAAAVREGKYYYIGQFLNERYAAMAYDIWAKELYKEYSSLNFKEKDLPV